MGEQAFGEFLVTQGVLSTDGLRRALEAQRTLECRLGTVLLDLGLVSERSLLAALGRFCSSRTVSGEELAAIPQDVVASVPARFALRHEVVPFRLEGKTLSVATIDPADLLVEDELKMLTDCRIASFVALEVRLDQALARYYGKQLSVQAVSLLKRSPGGREEMGPDASSTAECEIAVPRGLADGHAEVAQTVRPPRPTRRAGLAARRPPDDSAVVVLSDDELADFPSLRKALDDSGRGSVVVTTGGGQRMPSPKTEPGAAARDREEPQAEPDRDPDADTHPVTGVEGRLEEATRAMQLAEIREDIADAMLDFCAPYFRRRVLLAVREGVVMGWRGEGEHIDQLWVRALSIPLEEPSVFADLEGARDPWMGHLAPNSGNQELLLGLGGERPAACIVFPLAVQSRTIGFLYGDNLSDGLDDVPIRALQRLVQKAGLAFQVYMLRNKMRIL
jgi:hypothetical protein